jgi:2-C-methyl-D-erythritol 4-phosphate cytidylyltransferase
VTAGAGVAALVPAAGRGERLGAGPKALVEVAGRPLLSWALAALEGEVEAVVVAVPPEHVQAARAAHPTVTVITGGATRQATVAALLDATTLPWVLVHDAARPFLDGATVRACLAAARRHRAASVVTRVADTLIDAETGAAVDRERLRAVQTPQAFERALLARAHAEAAAEGVQATDDAALVRHLGVRVALVPGGAHLFKVTTAGDLALAEAFARALPATWPSAAAAH